MARSVPLVSTIFIFILLLVATGPSMMAEARTCESQSHKFKGPCNVSLEDTAVDSVVDAFALHIVLN
ncbi:hypothetical protein TSUD_154080 [Trifolium subterraneum]|uniref:Uncharacterized protein n=1 Tax=Trifolium subterraneum TaxID=3900 RepID=A0A2Z6NNX5_TRISU|nr:hypothetical protein TSUD_154080 [Trifolium subterraneum]